jgi:hypothetical protein
MSVFGDIEGAIAAALAPMLKSNGGTLVALRRFRGKAAEFGEHYNDARPCGFVGMVGTWTRALSQGHFADLTLPFAVTFLEANKRGEAAKVQGSGVAAEGPGLYELTEDAVALLDDAALRIAGMSAPLIPEITGGGITQDRETLETEGMISLRVVVPHYEFVTALRRVTGRL